MMCNFKIKMILAFAIVSFLSCKDDESHDSIKDIIVAHEWKLKSIKVSNIDVTSTVAQACFLDNSYVFRTSGKYDIKNNAQKCSPAELDVITDLDWVLSNDEKIVTLDGTAFNVISISHNEAILEGDLVGQRSTNTYVPVK